MKNIGVGAKRILIVEDEPAISDVCRRVLTGEEFEVDIAVNGKVAQDMLEERQYDLCLLDIRTPTMNGIELYQWLKEKHPQLAGGRPGDIHYWRCDGRRYSGFSGTSR